MKLIYSFVVTLALTCTSAAAATLTVNNNDSFGVRTGLFDRNTGAGVQTLSDSTSASNVSRSPLSISQFDPTLGTLESISVRWDIRAFAFLFTDIFTCRDSGIVNSSCENESFSHSVSVSTAVDLPGASTRVVVGNNGVQGTYAVASGDFGAFIGGGSLDVPWRISYSHSMSGTCDPNLGTVITKCEFQGQYNFDHIAGLTVRYDYKPAVTPPSIVPLPAGMPLLLAGLGLLGVLRRRR